MHAVIGEAGDLVISIERIPKGRRIQEVIHVESFPGGQYRIETYSGERTLHEA